MAADPPCPCAAAGGRRQYGPPRALLSSILGEWRSKWQRRFKATAQLPSTTVKATNGSSFEGGSLAWCARGPLAGFTERRRNSAHLQLCHCCSGSM